MRTPGTLHKPAPAELHGPQSIVLNLPDGIEALNQYRQAQYLVSGIDEATTPPDLGGANPGDV